jgi:hypothetical protein
MFMLQEWSPLERRLTCKESKESTIGGTAYVPLDHAIAKDTSGDYEKMLLALIGHGDA